MPMPMNRSELTQNLKQKYGGVICILNISKKGCKYSNNTQNRLIKGTVSRN